jgi:hypothetical protein
MLFEVINLNINLKLIYLIAIFKIFKNKFLHHSDFDFNLQLIDGRVHVVSYFVTIPELKNEMSKMTNNIFLKPKWLSH